MFCASSWLGFRYGNFWLCFFNKLCLVTVKEKDILNCYSGFLMLLSCRILLRGNFTSKSYM